MQIIILSNLLDSMNKFTALIISSIIFALMHMSNPNVSVLSIINIFLAGMLLGIYYIHRKNLWFSISVHLMWNFVQGPILGFEVSGLKIEGILQQELVGHNLFTGGEFGFEGSLLCTILSIAGIIFIHIKYKHSII